MIKLIYGDCVDVTKDIADNEVNLIITDPPYPDYYQEQFSYKDGVIDVLKKYFCKQFVFWSAKVDFPLSFTARHVWHKIGGMAGGYDFIYERNGGKRQDIFMGWRLNSIVSCQFAKEGFYNHKSQKPEKLIKNILEYSNITNGTIMDPFMGSGTVGVVCKKLGYDFTGIEINKDYFDIAKDRIDKIQLTGKYW